MAARKRSAPKARKGSGRGTVVYVLVPVKVTKGRKRKASGGGRRR